MVAKYLYTISILLSVFMYSSCSDDHKSANIPEEFRAYIFQESSPVEYREIIPFLGAPLPIPAYIMKSEAFEDIQMCEYLLKTSYSGYEFWSYKGVDFESLDGEPAYIFFLLVAPEESAGPHLKALARISRLLKDKYVRESLKKAADAKNVLKIIKDEDSKRH